DCVIRLMLRTQPESGKRAYGQRSLFPRDNLKIINAEDLVSVREIVIYAKRGEIPIQQTGDVPYKTRQASIASTKGLIWISPWVIIEDTQGNWIQQSRW